MVWGPIISQVGAWLTSLGITGAASAAIAFALFKFFGKSWLDGKFSKDLTNFKAEKDRELEKLRSDYQQETERLRAEVSRLLDRATKLHQREYEVLPEAWGLLNKAEGILADTGLRLTSLPDLESMTNDQLEEFLDSSELATWEKNEIKGVTNKNKIYRKYNNWRLLSKAGAAIAEYHNYILLNGVFIEDNIADMMTEVSEKLNMGLMHRRQIEQGFGDTDDWIKMNEAVEIVGARKSEIKRLIRARMFDVRLPDSSR